MAIRWSTPVERVQFGYLGATKLFTLIHPVTQDGAWLLRSNLPGKAAAGLAAQTFSREDWAKERADRFLGNWLTRYRSLLDEPVKED